MGSKADKTRKQRVCELWSRDLDSEVKMLMRKIIYTVFSWFSFDGQLFLSTIRKDINVAWSNNFFIFFSTFSMRVVECCRFLSPWGFAGLTGARLHVCISFQMNQYVLAINTLVQFLSLWALNTFSVVLCQSQMCRSNKQIFWVHEVNGITSWTDLFLSQFSWAQPRACRPGVGLPRLTQRTVRKWFTFALRFVHDSETHCTQRTVAEDVILVYVLCWKWCCVSHSLREEWLTGRGVDSRSATVLLKIALCC